MSNQTLSIDVPGPLFARLESQARFSNRSVEAETVEILAAAISAPVDPETIETSLSVLDDASLWRAARSRLADEATARSEELHFKAQREGLNEEERRTLIDLVRQYERAMLVRAHAAALLRQRGHDVSPLLGP